MWLSVRSGPARGHVEALPDQPFVLGRAVGCDLVLDDSKVSRRHAELVPAGNATVTVRDLGSGNGTFVNGERTTEREVAIPVQVQVGDCVLVLTPDRPQGAGATVIGDLADVSFTPSAVHRRETTRSLRRVTVLGVTAVAVALGVAGVLLIGGGDEGDRVAAAVARAGPSTVVVSGTGIGGSGSGWVYDASRGLVVTNFHVVNNATSLQVGTRTATSSATIVGTAPCEDLAVLKVRDARGLRALELGTQASLAQGEAVVAVGYPVTASGQADLAPTAGVVSVVRTVYREPSLDTPPFSNVVLTDAAVNPGNSGGPLLDLDGRLVGVNAAGRRVSATGRAIEGQAYAIGVDRVREVLPGLVGGRSPGWIGHGLRYAGGRITLGPRMPGAPAGPPALDGAELVAIGGQDPGATLGTYCEALASATGRATLEVRANGRTRRVRLTPG